MNGISVHTYRKQYTMIAAVLCAHCSGAYVLTIIIARSTYNARINVYCMYLCTFPKINSHSYYNTNTPSNDTHSDLLCTNSKLSVIQV